MLNFSMREEHIRTLFFLKLKVTPEVKKMDEGFHLQ